MVLRRVPSALVNADRVVLEGEPTEELPLGQVYISPTVGVRDGERGDTIEDLPNDAREIPKTEYFGIFGLGRKKRSSPPQSFETETVSIETALTEKKWFELPEGISRLRAELLEMKRYFPELELYQNDVGSLVWKGEIEGLGEVEVQYPEVYPRGLPRLVLKTTEAEKSELARKIFEHHFQVTPAVALVIAMKYLARRIPNGVVSDSSGSEKATVRG